MLPRLNQILALYFIPFFPFLDRCALCSLKFYIVFFFGEWEEQTLLVDNDDEGEKLMELIFVQF